MQNPANRTAMRLIVLVPLLGLSCVLSTRRVHRVTPPGGFAEALAPVRAHLTDGGVIVFPGGVSLRGEALYGDGTRYSFLRTESTRVSWVSVNNVVGLERYDVSGGAGVAIGLVPAAVVGGAYLFKALFGCCPTIYTYCGVDSTLEAEAFSFNVTRLMSGRDLDKLESGRPSDGTYRLLVTNEALETHYIDQLSLVAADHQPGLRALPTDDGRVVNFGKPAPIVRAVDATGRDVLPLLVSRDSEWFRTDSGLVRELADTMVHDWIDLAVPIPSGARRMVMAIRGRNTLLSTVMFYDVTLKGQGLAALDWMGMSRCDFGYARSLERWHHRHFGIRVLTPTRAGLRQLAWIKDTGPIAWHEVAVELPVTAADTCRLRLDLLPDNWVIDRVEVSFDQLAPAKLREWTPVVIDSGSGENLTAEAVSLRRNDGRYIVTGPGDRRLLTFHTGDVPAGFERDWFVRSGGYYTEWLRQEWLATQPAVWFEPDDRAISLAASLWLAKKEAFERQFAGTRLPLRRMP